MSDAGATLPAIGSQSIGDVSVGSGSNVKIGIFWNPDEDDEERRRLIEWLAPWSLDYLPNSQWKILHQHQSRRQRGTSTWLTEKLLPEWRRTGSRHLWLHGKVGCGKSVLCSAVIKALGAESPDKSDDLAHVFAFSAYNLEYSHEPGFLIRTVLARLCKIPAVYNELHKLRKLRQDSALLVDMDYDDMFDRVFASLDNEMLVVNPRVANSVLLVLDGLDEIPTIQARTKSLRQMKYIYDIHQRYTNLTFRVLLFSREDDSISRYCQPQNGWQRHQIPIAEVEGDIRAMIAQRVADHDKMSRLSEDKKQSILERVSEKSDGMFRLASLHMDDLERINLSNISLGLLQKILSTLPSDLFSVYDRILQKIENSQIRVTLLACLRLALFAAGPLYIEDLVEISIHPLPKTSALEGPAEIPITASDILDHLSGLLLARPEIPLEFPDAPPPSQTHMVVFAHYSVAEYLQRMSPDCWHIDPDYFEPKTVQLILTKMCFAYVYQEIQSNDPHQMSSPLLSYAREYWSHHAAAYIELELGILPAAQGVIAQLHSKINSSHGLTASSALVLRLRNMISQVSHDWNTDDGKELRRSLARVARECGYTKGVVINTLLDALHTVTNQRQKQPMYGSIVAYPNAIRLCVLWPAKSSRERITISLYAESLDNSPKYSALSYTWGAQDSLYSILVNGQSHTISNTLSHALVRIRDASCPKVLWIDAISINQNDFSEKEVQVKMMHSVFEQASQVLCWLGETPKKRAPLIEALQIVSRQVSPEHTMDLHEALHDIAQRSYFDHAWNIREMSANNGTVVRTDDFEIEWVLLRTLLLAHCRNCVYCRRLGRLIEGSLTVARQQGALSTTDDE